ncbi:MAG: enoyl-CoA hydratase/isomerase family protein [Actinobacteria bacterium]|nr:enoyl-CoA hydratase/isomerase family protein [Actinomycetota bacterium]
MPGDAVVVEVRDRVGWITINRPEKRNALDVEVREGLFKAFDAMGGDDDVLVVVLTGAGDKAFCAGGDLKEMSATSLKVPPPDFVPQLERNIHLDKPVIAAVNGIAYGGGFLLAQTCDLCVAAESARFAITEARWGRGSPWAAPLPWLIPPRLALELLVTADPIDAQRAFDVGLVNRVVPDGRLVAETQALACRIAENAPLSVRAGKAMVYATTEHHRSAAFEEAERLYERVYLSDDAQEGPLAFKERRAPQWQGR